MHIYIYIYIYTYIFMCVYMYRYTYIRHSVMRIKRLLCVHDMTPSYTRHDSIRCETWLLHAHDPRSTSCATIHAITCVWTWLHHACKTTPSCVWCGSFRRVIWLICVCGMTHSCVRRDLCMLKICAWRRAPLNTPSPVWHMTPSCVWRDSFVCVTWLLHASDMTHSCVWHDSFMCDMTTTCTLWRARDTLCVHSTHIHETRRTHDRVMSCACRQIRQEPSSVCDVTHSCVWRDSFMCVTWLIHVCDVTHSCVWHTSPAGVRCA